MGRKSERTSTRIWSAAPPADRQPFLATARRMGKNRLQALDIGGGWLFAISQIVWIAGERVFPPGLLILAQCRQGGLLGVVSPGIEQLAESTARHGLIHCHGRSDPSGQWPSAVFKPRPAQGQRQVQVVLGSVEAHARRLKR